MSWSRWRSFFEFAVRISCLAILFGGPLMVADILKPVIGKSLAAWFVVALPAMLVWLGGSALLDEVNDGWRTWRLRLGIFGMLLLAPMNLYAIGRLLRGDTKANFFTVAPVVYLTAVIVAYLYFAVRALQQPRPTQDAPTAEDLERPIE